MTIREFYEWAQTNGVSDLEFGINFAKEVDYEDAWVEYCEEVLQDDIEIGGYYEPVIDVHGCTDVKKMKDFVWINNH